MAFVGVSDTYVMVFAKRFSLSLKTLAWIHIRSGLSKNLDPDPDSATSYIRNQDSGDQELDSVDPEPDSVDPDSVIRNPIQWIRILIMWIRSRIQWIRIQQDS
jgi:hypothetical protein